MILLIGEQNQMRQPTVTCLACLAPLALLLVVGCSTKGAASPTTQPAMKDASIGVESDASLGAPSFLARFAKAQGQLPEGLWTVGGTPVVGWAPLATVVGVPDAGTAQPLISLGTAANTFTLGITSSAAGTLYAGVGAASVVGGAAASATPVTPAPGIYAVPGDGGAATVFSLGSSATPAMRFPNGLAFLGSELFVADSEGVVYTITSGGTATAWSQDPLLAPSQPACAGVVPLAIGANGIAIDSSNVYVTNTNFGRVLQIPIRADGTAGTAVPIAESCDLLAGADGIAVDTDGSFLVAVNAQNRIARVSRAGAISVLAEGAPLDTPASVLLDATGQSKQLLITNSSFFSAADAGAPGLLALPLP